MGGTGAAGPAASGTRVPIVPDGGWGWVVVLGAFLIHVIADGFVYSFGVLVDVLMKEFKADNTVAALIIALLTGLTLGSGPVASALANKYGCRVTTIIGAIIATVGCGASYFATSMTHVVCTVGVIMGIGFGLMYCPAIVIVTMYFEKKRALATGLTVCGAGVGTFLFAPINERIIAAMGWKGVFMIFTGIILSCVLCGAVFSPLQFVETKDEESEGEEEEKKAEEGDQVKEDAALLSPDNSRTRAFSSSSQIDNAGSVKGSKTSLKGALSLSHVGPAEGGAHRSRSGTVSSATGYLSKKDVFYTGSITNVNEFQQNPDKVRSVTSLHQTAEVEDSKGGALSTFYRMLNLGLLAEPAFLLFAISNLMTSVGFNSPLYFLPIHAEHGLKLSATDAAYTISVFGVCNTIGRIVFGLVCDHELPLPYGLGKDTVRNRLWIYNISLAICGILTACSFWFDGFYSLCVYAGAFGFTISSYVCLTSVILVDLLGLEKLTNAFGLLLLFQGVGTVFGPPVSGYLADVSGSYHPAFIFCGVNLFFSGIMLFAIPHFQRKHAAKQNGTAVKVTMH